MRLELLEQITTKRVQVVDEQLERVVARVEGPHLWLQQHSADRAATRLGLHPSLLWPSWLDR